MRRIGLDLDEIAPANEDGQRRRKEEERALNEEERALAERREKGGAVFTLKGSEFGQEEKRQQERTGSTNTSPK